MKLKDESIGYHSSDTTKITNAKSLDA